MIETDIINCDIPLLCFHHLIIDFFWFAKLRFRIKKKYTHKLLLMCLELRWGVEGVLEVVLPGRIVISGGTGCLWGLEVGGNYSMISNYSYRIHKMKPQCYGHQNCVSPKKIDRTVIIKPSNTKPKSYGGYTNAPRCWYLRLKDELLKLNLRVSEYSIRSKIANWVFCGQYHMECRVFASVYRHR